MGMAEEEREAGRGGGPRGGRGAAAPAAAPLAFSSRCGKTFRFGGWRSPPPPPPASSRGPSPLPSLSGRGAESQALRSGSRGTKVPLALRSWLAKYVFEIGGLPGGAKGGSWGPRPGRHSPIWGA